MKRLQDILYKAGVVQSTGQLDIEVHHLTFDSRVVTECTCFVAIAGTHSDGHHYIDQAIAAGATSIVCSSLPETLNPDITYITVKDSALALGIMADNFYDHPSKKLVLVGITGTNGKTTTATLLYNLFTALGFQCGLISTIRNINGLNEINSTHTTPDSVQLNALLADMVYSGCDYVFMEVSSHAVDQQRIAGLHFTGGVFTNLTHDHLDYHLTFKAYLEAKKKFFDNLSASAFALSNIDDKNGRIMLQNTKATKKTYGIKNMADFHCRIMENRLDGMHLKIDGDEIYSPLSGLFNAYNLMAIYATAILLGQAKQEVLQHLSALKGAEGRFDIIHSKTNVSVIIDYAHTPDALENVLNTLDTLRTHNEQLITVTGAGGDRDKTKRPLMAGIACRMSSKVILTSDNPRTEDPEQILADMAAGIPADKKARVLIITNRKEAIKTAWSLAQPGDMILIAGKGHEKYQEINGVRHHFDDKEIIAELMNLS